MHGAGQRINAKGEIQEGEFRYHKFSGLGRMIYTDGSMYLGSWKSGEIP